MADLGWDEHLARMQRIHDEQAERDDDKQELEDAENLHTMLTDCIDLMNENGCLTLTDLVARVKYLHNKIHNLKQKYDHDEYN